MAKVDVFLAIAAATRTNIASAAAYATTAKAATTSIVTAPM